MMLAGGNAFGLQSFTGGILQELHFSAEVDAIEIRINQIVAMKIKFASIPCFYESVSFLEQLGHAPPARHFVDFDIAAPVMGVVLQFSDCCLERISYDNEDVLVSMIMADRNFSSRRREIDPHFIKAALLFVLVGSFDRYLTMHDLAGKLVQLFGASTDLGFNCI